MIQAFAAALIAGAGDVAAAPGYTQKEMDAAGVSALLLVALAFLLSASIFAFALVLRKRAQNPPPEALLLEEVCAERDEEEAMAGGNSGQASKEKRQPWEKPQDWWKPESS